ncbi:hypothetical protein [Spirillospora sp. NPDC029432]|uniref:divisome protein SepX/GlpR n=1 Tax=Spirillospora sp. NPDC029432 TaxID=3154599 RepID=UPI00345525A3
MSSAVLYLAIVAVWAVVLVPMWLRRDVDSKTARTKPEEHDEDLDEPTEPPELAETPPRRRSGRAAVIARRRRRTSGLGLLLATTAVVTAAGVAPWWITVPPALLLAGHLALLRVAVGMDAARRQERAARAAAARRAEAAAAQAAAEQPKAEIIELVAPAEEEVFDQYADDRKAVGE